MISFSACGHPMESPITSGSEDQISKKKDTGSGVMEHLLATQTGVEMRDPMDLGRTVLQWRLIHLVHRFLVESGMTLGVLTLILLFVKLI